MVWGKNGTPITLGSALDDMDITDLTAKIFNVFLLHTLNSGSTGLDVTFNNNSNSVYARRFSQDGAADGTSVSQTKQRLIGAVSYDNFAINYTVSISSEEKLTINSMVLQVATGAGTAPSRNEQVYKFVPSPDADITRIDVNNPSTGDFAISSNLSALGTD